MQMVGLNIRKRRWKLRNHVVFVVTSVQRRLNLNLLVLNLTFPEKPRRNRRETIIKFRPLVSPQIILLPRVNPQTFRMLIINILTVVFLLKIVKNERTFLNWVRVMRPLPVLRLGVLGPTRL